MGAIEGQGRGGAGLVNLCLCVWLSQECSSLLGLSRWAYERGITMVRDGQDNRAEELDSYLTAAGEATAVSGRGATWGGGDAATLLQDWIGITGPIWQEDNMQDLDRSPG